MLVKIVATGLCHSDEHVVTGDMAGATAGFPLVGGHEGAGVVIEVGAGVTDLAAGDHVVFGFVPACGRCAPCVTGHSNVCETAAAFPSGMQISDGTARHHLADGTDLRLMCLLGTFAEHTVVNEASCVKIDKSWPLDKACLLGCGVVTGWGSSVYAAEVKPGEYVAVVGCGGIGMNAVQGARMAGARVITAIDPVESKREISKKFGATHAYASVDEAIAGSGDATWGRGYDKVIMAMGVGDNEVLAKAFWLAGKRSRIVVTNIHPTHEQSLQIPGSTLTLLEKQLVGTLFGSGNVRFDIPRLLELYTQGQLNLDDLITQTYTLDQLNDGYAAMRRGDNIRGRGDPRRGLSRRRFVMVKLSIGTPIVTMTPGWHSPWEPDGTIDDIARIAATADQLGYHHMTCSEHVALPHAELARRGARYWDPLSTFGFLAARTQRIKFTTSVLVLGYHHPLEIAKRYGTLDKVSGGRLILGVGVGSLEQEFELVGASFADRGVRGDDAMKALRAALSQPIPEYHGEFYDFAEMVVDPCAVQAHVPLWVGGRTLRSSAPCRGAGRRLVSVFGGARASPRMARSSGLAGWFRGRATTNRAPRPDRRARPCARNLGLHRSSGGDDDRDRKRTETIEEYLEFLTALAELHEGEVVA